MSTPEIYSLILALLGATVAGLVGSFALMKRMVLAGDVMSHIALPGLGLALLFKLNPLIGGAVALFLGTILIWKLESKTGLTTEAIIGVIFAASVAVGALVTPQADLIEALFGGVQPISLNGFVFGSLIALALIFILLKLRNKIILNLFSPELAVATGLPIQRLNLYYLLTFSAALLLGLQYLGDSCRVFKAS